MLWNKSYNRGWNAAIQQVINHLEKTQLELRNDIIENLEEMKFSQSESLISTHDQFACAQEQLACTFRYILYVKTEVRKLLK